ncbi:MAG: CHASE2 domain-containing protein, partial [Myxococcota bacterium]
GDPPWSGAQLDRVVSEILAGSPRLVAVLEGTRLLTTGTPARTAQTDGRLVTAAALGSTASHPAGLAQPALHIDRGAVDRLILRHDDGTHSVLGQVVKGLDLPAATLDQVRIDYRGPPDTLPTIAAHRVASGEIPGATFTDRIVLVGAQGQAFAPLLPTPVGPMSPAQIQTHALTGMLDGSAWTEPPPLRYWLAVAALGLLLLVVLPRLKTVAVAAVASLLAVAALVIDYWLFASDTALLGCSAFIATIAAVLLCNWLYERQQTRIELAEFSRWLARQADTELESGSLRGRDPDFLRKFLEASRTYVDFHSAIFAELPQGAHHLTFTLYTDAAPDQVFERRRDVRREPYSTAYRTHRPEWATRPFMQTELELKTLMVPFVELGRILGYWIVNFPKDTSLSRRQLQIIEMLSDQASIILDRRRLQHKVRQSEGRLPSRSPTVLLGQLRDTRQTAASVVQSQNRIDELFENLPFGVLVA